MALTDNLQAFYKLSDLSDSSGYNRTLTNNGNVSFASGKLGNAAEFDGSNSLTLNSLPNENSTESTITLWFKENLPIDDSECFYITGGEAESQFAIIRVGGDIKGLFTNSGDGFFANGTNADDGNWHFAAIRFTPTTFKIWLDGSSNAQDGSFNAISSSPFFRIGSNWDGSYLSHNGQIDAVGIWNRALSDAEVAELYNNGNGLELEVQAPVVDLEDGLQAFYKLSDTSDSSGNNRTLTNNGSVSFASGKIGNAAVFDGSNYLSSNFAFPSQSNWTLSFWINQAQENPTDATTAIGNWGNDEYEQFIITTYEQGFASYKVSLRGDSGNSYYNFNSGITPNIGSWDFVVVRFFNNEKIEMSVNDGQWVTDNTPVNITSNGGNPFVIGTLGEVTSFGIIGQIDSVGIWNRALSDAEVAELYNNGTGLEIDNGGGGGGGGNPTLVKMQAPVKFFGKVKFGV